MNRPATAGAGLLAGVLILGWAPTAATAAPLQPGHAAQHHADSHGHGHGHGPHGRHFNLTGLVTAANGTDLQVLVGQGQLGGKRLANQSVPIVLGAHRNRSASAAVGNTIHAQGTADPQTGQLEASNFTVQPSDTSAMVGVLDAINGTTIYVNVSAAAGSDGQGDQGEGYSGDGQDGGDDVAVDVTQASVSLDGQPASLAQLATGQTVAILGETDDDSVLASQVLAYSTAPGVAEGTLTQVSGNLLMLSSGGGDQASGDDETSSATVDVTNSQIILDGQPAASVSQLAPGDAVLAVGPAGSDPLAATTTFAFGNGEDGQGD